MNNPKSRYFRIQLLGMHHQQYTMRWPHEGLDDRGNELIMKYLWEPLMQETSDITEIPREEILLG